MLFAIATLFSVDNHLGTNVTLYIAENEQQALDSAKWGMESRGNRVLDQNCVQASNETLVAIATMPETIVALGCAKESDNE